MVSGEKAWDPHHAGRFQPHLSGKHRAPGRSPLHDSPCVVAKGAALHRSRRLPPLSSPPPPGAPSTFRPSFSSSEFHPASLYSRSQTEGLHKPARCPSVVSQSEEEAERRDMKGKRLGCRADATPEDKLDDMGDGAKNAKITLSFPLNAAPLPTSLTSPNHCHGSSSASPSPHHRRLSAKGADKASLWKLDATTDVKHRPFKPPRRDGSPSSSPSSSSSPMSVPAFMRKDLKSPPPLKCSKLNAEAQIHRSPPRSSSGPLGGCFGGDGWGDRYNGTASPSQTAQILFSLGTSAYQRGGEAERREKLTGRPAGKAGSPHGPSLHPPTLHFPPPLPPPPPLPSEGLTAPPHSSSYPPTDSLKPELICGVCHRLFSSASSLTVHMRLHRGSRALSCRYCGKVFIHSKRLQSHETSCRLPGLSSGNIIKARPGKKARSLLARLQGDDAAGELLAGDENHFVKVVDGNIIYFCSVCERSYMTLSSLKRHSNVHSWRRKYPCHYCDKVFALAEYRTKHEVWHTGERRYQCIFCWDAFATYYNLKTHQKTIHGINPSLISSEKTANGGYKQKANALKLYRLLPMRSQKRPYKTYSDSLHNGLLLPPADAPSLSLPGLGCALAPEDLQSLIVGAPPQSVKPDPDAFPDEFPVSITAEHGDLSALTPLPRTDAAQVRKLESDTSESEQDRGGFKMSNRSKTKTLKTGRGAETSMPSVITYGHTKPSVIVHGAAVSSSVIVHSNQVSSGSNKSPVNSPSPETSSSQTLIKGSPRPIKKRRDSADNHRKRSKDGADTTEEGSRGRQDAETGRLFHKSRKFHSKSNVPASKQASAPAGSQGKEAGPLCQITVRIGEEAIVKRSISETDLRRDKSLSPRNGSKSPDQVREYYFRRGVREQDSDNDMEDNLWRPYYSYKPKRKAQAHLQRVKSWQQKLKYKRSIRLKRRTERLKRLLNKQTDKSQDEEDDGTAEEAEKLSKPHKAAEEGKETDDCSPPPKEKETDAEERVEEARRQVPSSPVPSPKPPPRPWTNGNAAECGTCGRWFSSPRKRDKHELSHLLEFVCLFCRATFPSRDKLEDHQRVQHPKPAEAAPAPSMCGSSSSPSRVSRRALSRHTCLQCHKVCKTSSALNRHVRRHELSSSPEREKEELSSEPQPPPQTFINALCTDSEADKGQTPTLLPHSPPPSSLCGVSTNLPL
uniref:Zinc finger and BTB domain containing 4 n=1 Tax=Kryptolebias marmoratus TaxID=37003 RepID=A0A3Q3AZQ1_KRYMA